MYIWQQILPHKGVIIIAAVSLFLILGRMFPFARQGGFAQETKRIAKNISLAALNGGLSIFIVLPISLYASEHALNWRPVWWSGGFGLCLDLIILDMWIYGWHRLMHLWPVLWRFHRVHHLDETLDSSTALRFHFGEVFLSSLVRGAVIIMLGVPWSSIVVFELIVTLASVFQHSNVRLPKGFERALSWFIVTPQIHWLHHHAKACDTDSNYANFLSVWDRIFGSQNRSKRFEDMVIGIEGEKDKSFFDLLIWPLYNKTK